jgi:hypothetical protein
VFWLRRLSCPAANFEPCEVLARFDSSILNILTPHNQLRAIQLSACSEEPKNRLLAPIW